MFYRVSQFPVDLCTTLFFHLFIKPQIPWAEFPCLSCVSDFVALTARGHGGESGQVTSLPQVHKRQPLETETNWKETWCWTCCAVLPTSLSLSFVPSLPSFLPSSFSPSPSSSSSVSLHVILSPSLLPLPLCLVTHVHAGWLFLGDVKTLVSSSLCCYVDVCKFYILFCYSVSLFDGLLSFIPRL